MKVLCILLLLLSASVTGAEDILVSFISTREELIVLRVNFANNKYKIVDRAVFPITSTGGLTALAPFPDGSFQVVWNQRDTSNKIKVFSRTISPTLDAAGTVRKNSATLTSFFNLNILPNFDQFSIDFKNNVFLRTRAANGNLGAGAKKLVNIPTGFDAFNTSITEFKASSLRGSSFQGEDLVTCVLIFDDERGYGVILKRGVTPDDQRVAAFATHVVDTVCIPADLVDGFEPGIHFMHAERVTPPSGRVTKNSVTTISLKTRKLDSRTFAPQGAITTLVKAKPADRLGTVPFFNMFAVAGSRTATARGANTSLATGPAHVFYVEQNNTCNSTVLKGFHFNVQTGKRDTGFSTLIPCSDSLLQGGGKFFYGLSALLL